jgi:hypothetical protein
LTVPEHTHPEIGRIIDVLEGEEKIRLDGSTEREGGLVDAVDRISSQLQNGIRYRLSGADWARIIVAVIALVGVVFTATIELIPRI